MGEMRRVDIVSFNPALDRTGFRCGHADLDDWVKTQAGQQERRDTTRTFLAIDPAHEGVAGYYATTTYRVDLDEAAQIFGVGKRRYPIPAVLLARLAVDSRCTGRGIGRQLLLHALEGIAGASRNVGFELVVVHAIDADAAAFYAKHGFTRVADQDRYFFITTASLRATLSDSNV